MKANRTALGVASGLQQANFVFGGLAKTTGVTFHCADNLKLHESIAQQHLDFIQKLYFEQSYLGEYFEEIHLGIVPHSGSPETLSLGHRMVEVLVEQINEWIAVDQLNVVLHVHTGMAVKAQSKYLEFNSATPGILASGSEGMADAYALWSFIFTEAGDISKSKVFKKYQPINYTEMSEGIADHYLDRYKNDLIASFSETMFRDVEVEKQRQHLLELANISQSGKHELLICREGILAMLEAHSRTKELMPESSITGKVTVAGSRTAPARQERLDVVLETPDLDSLPAEVARSPLQTPVGTNASQKQASLSSESSKNDFFTSPNFTVSDNMPQPAPGDKTWHEPNGRKIMKYDAWIFRLVVVLVVIVGYFLVRRF